MPIAKNLKALKRDLRRYYPPHHWAHTTVLSKYWELVGFIKESLSDIKEREKIKKVV